MYVESKWETIWWEEKETVKWCVSVQDMSEGRVKLMELHEMEKLICKKEEFVVWLW